MTWIEVVVLGLVQGLTEFLPVSSSGHLRITSALFFDRDAGASFTAVTQLGTETAVLLYFAKDIWRITRTWFVGIGDRSVRSSLDYRMAWYVIIGSIPIGLFGLAFKDQIRTAARNLWLVATMLIVFSFVKFVMVALYFMHLKFDNRIFKRLFVLGLILAFVVFGIVLATFFLHESGSQGITG